MRSRPADSLNFSARTNVPKNDNNASRRAQVREKGASPDSSPPHFSLVSNIYDTGHTLLDRCGRLKLEQHRSPIRADAATRIASSVSAFPQNFVQPFGPSSELNEIPDHAVKYDFFRIRSIVDVDNFLFGKSISQSCAEVHASESRATTSSPPKRYTPRKQYAKR